MQADTVVVIGAPRSGTSSIAQAISELGVYFDEPEALVEANEDNPDGYWEHKKISGILGHFHLSINQHNRMVDTLPDDWLNLPRTKVLAGNLRDVIDERFSGHPVWGVKVPIASTFLPFIEEAWGKQTHLVYVICLRHPVTVAQSSYAKFGLPPDFAIGLWLWHTIEALKGAPRQSTTVIPFPDVVENPRPFLERIVKLTPNLNPSAQQWTTALASFKPGLVRKRTPDSSIRIPRVATVIYELALRCAAEPEQYQAGAFDEEIDRLWLEMRDWQNMFRMPFMLRDNIEVWYQKGQGFESKQVEYSPSRDWQTVSIEFPVIEGTLVPIHFYNLPVIIWVRKLEWHVGDHVEKAVMNSTRFGVVKEFDGYYHISLVPGKEQCVVEAPSVSGDANLLIEFMIHTNPKYESDTYLNMSAYVEKLQAQVAAMQATKPVFGNPTGTIKF